MRSLERRLLVSVLGALALGAAALVATLYLVALDEMDEIFDETLREMAQAVVTQHRFDIAAPPRPAPLPRLAGGFETHDDAGIVTLAWTLEGVRRFTSDPAAALPFGTPDGLADVRAAGVDWRVYTVTGPHGVVQAAQPVALRRDLAVEVATSLVAPLLALVLLTAVLMVVVLRRGLRPLDAAAAGIAARSAVSLAPIGAAGMPREIHPLIQAINDLMARLARAFSLQRQFVADAAHELRTPVAALRLQAQWLERAADAAARAAAVAELKAGIARAEHLVAQLLHLSRVEPEAPQQALQRLDLAGLARDGVARFSAQADAAGIDLGAEATEALAVDGDPEQLQVLLGNLVVNALHHTPAGGRIDVRATRVRTQPALQVIDTGPGIPPAERERVFDRFYRVAVPGGRDGDTVGSGLGLAIVAAIAGRHNATVSLGEGPHGRGLAVSVVFPAPAG